MDKKCSKSYGSVREAFADGVACRVSFATNGTSESGDRKIALYQVFIGIVQFLNLPLSYVFLRLGFSVNAVYVVAIFCSDGLVLFRTLFLRRIAEFDLSEIIRNVFIPCGLCATTLFVFVFFVKLGKGTFLSFFLDIFLKISVSTALIFFIGLSKIERKSITDIALSKIKNRSTK